MTFKRHAVSLLRSFARSLDLGARALFGRARYIVRAYADASHSALPRAEFRLTELNQRLRGWASGAGPPVFRVLIVILLGASVLGVSLLFVAKTYNGELIWPLLVVGLVTTSVGVYLAIYVERELSTTRELNRRRTIARSALSVIAVELGQIENGAQRVRAEYARDPFIVGYLPTGSWQSVRPALTASVDSPAFLAELSSFYARVEALTLLLEKRMGTVMSSSASFALTRKIGQTLDEIDLRVGELREDINELIREPPVRGRTTHRTLAD